MFCAISGVAPEEPVVSKKSGHVFEKSLVLKALAASGGKCPVTGEDLEESDLIEVQLSGDAVRPVPSSAVTLPGILKHLRDEWEAVMLESHQVKQALAVAHQELAAALYKYDAATRVIARLVEERDEARAALANPSASEQEAKLTHTAPEPSHKDIEALNARAARRTNEGPEAVHGNSERKCGKDDSASRPSQNGNSALSDGNASERKEKESSGAKPASMPADVLDKSSRKPADAAADEAARGDLSNFPVPKECDGSGRDRGDVSDVADIREGDGSGEDRQAPPTSLRLPQSALDIIRAKNAELTAMRKGRKPGKDILSRSVDIREYSVTHATAVWSSSGGSDASTVSTGVTSMQVVTVRSEEGGPESPGSEAIAVGCHDGAIRMYSAAELSPLGVTLQGAHTGGVLCLDHNFGASSLLFSGGANGAVRAWNVSALRGEARVEPSREKRLRAGHGKSDSHAVPSESVVPSLDIREMKAGPVVGVAVHPSGEFILSTLVSGRWRMHSVESGVLVSCGQSSGPAECCSLHPDGAIFAIGRNNGLLDLWDLSSDEGYSSPVVSLGHDVVGPGCARAITMSENGCFVVVAGGGGLRLWDLRTSKLSREARICPEESISSLDDESIAHLQAGVALDISGVYCIASVGDGGARLFETKKLKRLLDIRESSGTSDSSENLGSKKGGLVGLAWGQDALCAFVGTADGRILRLGRAATPNDDSVVAVE